MPTRNNRFSNQKAPKMGIDEASAIALLSDCSEVAKTLFIELVNLHADQRRDWGDDLTFGTDMHYLLLGKLGIHTFTGAEMDEIYRIVKANKPGGSKEEIRYACRFVAYNQYLEHLVKHEARLDHNGKLVFRAVVSEYVSPYPKELKAQPTPTE